MWLRVTCVWSRVTYVWSRVTPAAIVARQLDDLRRIQPEIVNRDKEARYERRVCVTYGIKQRDMSEGPTSLRS